jgi:hypothetical protein
VLGLALAVAATAPAEPASIEPLVHGTWQGELSDKGKTLRVVLKVWRQGGDLLARVYSPDQSDQEYIVQFIRLKERRIELDIPVLFASYDGILIDGDQEIRGRWMQYDTRTPLTFRKVSGL